MQSIKRDLNTPSSSSGADSPAQIDTLQTNDASARPDAAAWYALAMLTVAGFFANVDRGGIVVLLQPIKADLGASDTQMALLSGLAVSIFFILFGIPIARWVDVGVRKRIMSVAIFTWSAMTVLSGRSTTVVEFGLTRAGLGIAEAAVVPAAVSMLGDLFPRSWRHRAFSIFYASTALTPTVGAPIAAILGDTYGWRTALGTFGVAGMILAPIYWLTVKEPVRNGFYGATAAKEADSPPLRLMRAIFTNKALMLHILSCMFAAVGVGALLTWSAAFAMRAHGLSLTAAGAFTSVCGLVILVSTPTGGWICSWLTGRSVDDRKALGLCAIAALVTVPAFVVAFSAESRSVFFVAILSTLFFAYIGNAPRVSLAAEMVPPQMRGMVTAILLGSASTVGVGVAPMVIGAVADNLAPEIGSTEALRWGLLCVVPGPMLLAAIVGWRSLKYVQPQEEVGIKKVAPVE